VLGAGVSFGTAVHLRNEYARGDLDSPHGSNVALNTGVVLAAVLAATRIGAGLGYEYGGFWKRDRP
jgi:hypothetical protein